MSQWTFSDTLIRLETFKIIFVFRPEFDFFFKGVGPGFWVKNDQIIEVGIFHP